MVSEYFPTVMLFANATRLVLTLVIMSTLVTGCRVRSRGTEDVGIIAATQEIDTQSTNSIPPSDNATVTEPAQVVTNESLGYCFAYPQGFTQQTNDSQVEIVGPHSGSGPQPGLVWIDATEAQGRSAQDIANEEVNAFGGSPPRSTVMMGGEEALVLDGMPGQDAIRKVYIVHNGLLYTLNFSPYQSENTTANAQMEALFASITSSWVWMSSGRPCPATD
jgi:hypothetical protein